MRMLKQTAFLAIFLFSAISGAFAEDRRLQCKIENSALDNDIDISITHDASGLFFNVKHHIPSGETFDREMQFSQREVFFNKAKNLAWTGHNIKRPFLFMVGEIDVRGPAIKYTETLRDSYKADAMVNVLVSTCTLISVPKTEQNQSSLAPPLEAPAPAPPPPDAQITQAQPESPPQQPKDDPAPLVQTPPIKDTEPSKTPEPTVTPRKSTSLLDSYISKVIAEVSGILIVIYFLPTVIAASRGHLSTVAIFALNLIFGWTLFGWLVAFIWSLTGNTKKNRDAWRP